jgi:adenosylcobinamide-phosphate synthase
LVGHSRQGLRCWRQQAPLWYGPNPGVVMSSGAGAMNLLLGGPAQYHGLVKQRPLIGAGQVPTVADIERSVLFVQRGLWLWLAVIFCGAWALA